MTRIKLSPVVEKIGGTIGNSLFGSAKGQVYLRSRFKPRNDKTPNQVAQRQRLSKVNAWWKVLPEKPQAYCGLLGQLVALTGYNAFLKQNIKDMYDGVPPKIIPAASPLLPVLACHVEPMSNPTETLIWWEEGEAPLGEWVFVLVEKAETPPGESQLVVASYLSNIIGESGIFYYAPEPSTLYNAWVMVHYGEDDHFSVAKMGTGMSGPSEGEFMAAAKNLPAALLQKTSLQPRRR